MALQSWSNCSYISPALSDWYNQLMYVANRYIRKYNVYQFIIASLKVDMSILLLSMQSEISKIPSVHAFGITYHCNGCNCLLIDIFC